MYCKKNVVSLFVVLSVLISGMFMACDQLSNPQPKNEIIEAEIVTIESTAQGNKLSWKTSDLPENTDRITVEYWAPGIFFLDLFEINDMTITQVLDEYVTAGKDYSYRICCYDSTGKELCRDHVEIKAIGGKGELKVNLEATAEGIHLTADKNSDNSKFYLLRRPSDVPENDFNTYEYYELKMNNQDLNFTDKLVAAGSEYRYYIEEQTGKRTQINGAGEKTVGDKIVIYPRYEINTIKATGGSGEFKITKQPVITFDAENLTVALTKQPEFTLNPDDYEINLFYKSSDNNSRYFGCFTSTQTQFKVNNLLPGEWQFDRCTCWFQYVDFTYRYSFYKDDLPDFLQKITVPENSQSQQQSEPLTLLARPIDAGIKLEWENLPEETKKLEIITEGCNERYDGTLFRINNLTDVTTLTDKFVTPNNEYSYCIRALDEYGNYIELSEWVKVTATCGSGEKTFTATAEEDGIHITAQKSQANTELQFRKVLSSSTSDFWDAINVYSQFCNDGIDFTDIFVSEATEYTYSICETVGNEGTWNGSTYENADNIVEFPRYKKVTVKATGGVGTPDLSNESVGDFNEERTQFIFTTAPQITLSDKMYSWNLTVKYNLGQATWGEKNVIDYWNTKEYGNVYLPQNKGTWYLSSYVFYIQIGDIQWYIKGADLSKLSGIPQSFTIE